MKLRHVKFCNHYLLTLNAAEAARQAGYSENGARQIGAKLLTKVDIQQKISKQLNEAMGFDSVILKAKVLKLWEIMAFEHEKPHVRLRASELLAKYLGLFASRLDSVEDHGDYISSIIKLVPRPISNENEQLQRCMPVTTNKPDVT